ncbi:carbohydrate ABC transporter permease [Paenibacillus agricola]|uniref:Sugar ABC transporter permease n=1 Tax=Paenibacillus agricola TaxID=2716264 RepID=A0ABX0JCD2_9BACL|nr:sugar ABC transporter permease [Paenibacillus agricola]NHN31335.1 sugar ABC transporter permease [Paenibacillus agricola]
MNSNAVAFKDAPTVRPWLTERRRSRLAAYLFIAPFFLLFAVFGVYPIFFTFYLSMYKWNGMGDMKFVGLKNFELVLTDPTFWTSVSNTFIMGGMGTIPQLIVALILAVGLNSAFIRGTKLLRAIYFLPNITSIVAVTMIFSAAFANKGMANYLISLLDLGPYAWNVQNWPLKIAVATMVIWRWTGYNAIIFLAGLQSIPGDLYEAARIDGANRRQLFTFITIPLLKPFILFAVLISTIGSIQLFTEPFVFLSQGGSGSTRSEGITMVIYLYTEAFRNSFFGTAAASAVILFLFTIIFSMINTWLSKRMGGEA